MLNVLTRAFFTFNVVGMPLDERIGIRMTKEERRMLRALVRHEKKETGFDFDESKLLRSMIRTAYQEMKGE